MAKESKQSAQYVPHATRQHCSGCEHWRQGACTEVSGSIAPDATCRLYEKAKAGKK